MPAYTPGKSAIPHTVGEFSVSPSTTIRGASEILGASARTVYWLPLLLSLFLTLVSSRSGADDILYPGSRFAVWDGSYDSSFPVVPIVTCSNTFSANFVQPWANILSNLQSA